MSKERKVRTLVAALKELERRVKHGAHRRTGAFTSEHEWYNYAESKDIECDESEQATASEAGLV
jgi:hypothetical protein